MTRVGASAAVPSVNMLSFVLLSCLFISCCNPVTAQYLPNSQALTITELEHLYLDAAPNGFKSAVSPCSNYFDPSTGGSNNGLGRQTASEWIRTAFRKLHRSSIASSSIPLEVHNGCIEAVFRNSDTNQAQTPICNRL